MNDSDFVFTNDATNGIYSGGYKVDSLLLKNGMSPVQTVQFGGGIKSKFEDLVIPNWAIYYGGFKVTDTLDEPENESVVEIAVIDDDVPETPKRKRTHHPDADDEPDYVSDSLVMALAELVSDTKKQKQTKPVKQTTTQLTKRVKTNKKQSMTKRRSK